jgi:hypothetical protein
VVRDHPKKLLEMVMASVDRCITRREAPPGHKLGVLDIHSKVCGSQSDPAKSAPCRMAQTSDV